MWGSGPGGLDPEGLGPGGLHPGYSGPGRLGSEGLNPGDLDTGDLDPGDQKNISFSQDIRGDCDNQVDPQDVTYLVGQHFCPGLCPRKSFSQVEIIGRIVSWVSS